MYKTANRCASERPCLVPPAGRITAAESYYTPEAAKACPDSLAESDATSSSHLMLSAAYSEVFEAVDNAIFILAAATLEIVDINPRAEATLYYSRKELLSMRLTELVLKVSEQDVEFGIHRESAESIHNQRIPITFRRKNGGEYHAITTFRRAGNSDTGLIVAVCRNVSDLRATTGLPEAERIDPVTGLPDRTFLTRRLWEAIDRARNGCEGFAVIFVDIDRFKDINDRWGHLTGDRVLSSVAAHLVSCARPSDYVIRYGGDEFVLILEKVRARRDALKIAARLCRQLKFDLRPLIYIDGNSEHAAGGTLTNPCLTTASVGLAMYTHDLLWPEDLVDRADRDMYRRKRTKTSRREGPGSSRDFG